MTRIAETEIFKSAVSSWWASKSGAKPTRAQGGTRDQNLHGKTMNGFTDTIREFLIGLGVEERHIFAGAQLGGAAPVLPSYFRASKNWDLIVVSNSRFHSSSKDSGKPTLYAALEFKSQSGSIGNNQNNRLEESIGNAHDFWVTYENAGFERLQPRPWLGYLFIGIYDEKSHARPVLVKQPHFPATPPFQIKDSASKKRFLGHSYAKRYEIFLKQCLGRRLYDAGAFLVTDESISKAQSNHRVLFPEFGPAPFLRSLKAQILAQYPGATVRPNTLADWV